MGQKSPFLELEPVFAPILLDTFAHWYKADTINLLIAAPILRGTACTLQGS